jgi:hypothetical protein
VCGRIAKGMVVVVLIWSGKGEGAPTLVDWASGAVVDSAERLRVERPAFRLQMVSAIGHNYWPLAAVAAECYRPSVRFSRSSAAIIDAKSLPPVPGTLVMVLVGFLCVTLVRDRRVWLAGVLGLLWAGQTGFSLLPHLSSSSDDGLCEPTRLSYRRGDIQDTYCAMQLRHLAGTPNGRTSVAFSKLLLLSPSPEAFKPRRVCDQDRFHASIQSAIVRWVCFSGCVAKCVALRSEQPIHLSTAFGSRNTARGPPDSVYVINLLHTEG